MSGTSYRISILLLLSCVLTAAPANAGPRHPNLDSLSNNSRELFLTSMQWGDLSWHEEAGLCSAPVLGSVDTHAGNGFLVRESTWYALGLLLRDQPGDRARAARILNVALNEQYREPGKPWDGTFRRTLSEPEPGANAVMWRDYDPNWREFIGTTFAIILSEYADRIPPDLSPRMIEAIDHAVAGEIEQKRLVPSYTNIALMYGFLWNFAAVKGDRPDWTSPSVQWQEDIYKLFKQHDAFAEYNSPTYTGADIFGLALWRDYGFTARTRTIGSEMEASLWRTTADFYNANLRNLSGPFDRAYGMDMQSYVSVVGLWLRTVLDAGQAPLPRFNPPVNHVADMWFVPALVVLDARIPDDAMKCFRAFPGDHQVRRQITDRRIATAWIGKNLIYGGEITNHTELVDSEEQFHPVTVQWQTPTGAIGWIRLTRCPLIDASADKQGIVISAQGDLSFRISVPGAATAMIKFNEWNLPGLAIHVDSDYKTFKAEQHSQFLDVSYTGISKMTLSIKSLGG